MAVKQVRFDDAATGLKLGFRKNQAAEVFGSMQLLDDMVRARWIVPVVNRHKLVIFDRGDLQRAWARLLSGEQPPQRVRNRLSQKRDSSSEQNQTQKMTEN